MKKHLPLRWLFSAATVFALSSATSAQVQAKRVVPASIWLPPDGTTDDPKGGSWLTRVGSSRWVHTPAGPGPRFEFAYYVLMPKATLGGVIGTVLRADYAGGDLFIPDLNSGSRWVGVRSSSPTWQMRWKQYSKASAKPRAVALSQPLPEPPPIKPGDPVAFLEAIRDNRMSDVRRMLGQDRSLANASGKIKYGSFNEGRFTALGAAMHFQRVEMARLILQRGASRRSLNSFLLSSVYGGEEEFVRLLVSFGASLEAKNGDEDTAIFVAVRRDNLKMAKLLKSLGANLRAQNIRGYTPSEYATLIRNPVMADLLRPR